MFRKLFLCALMCLLLAGAISAGANLPVLLGMGALTVLAFVVTAVSLAPTDLRRRIINKAIAMSDLPALFLYHPVYNYAIDSSVQGVSVGPLFDPGDRLSSITDWFLVARRADSSN